jgi:hypothetical protein
MSDLGLALGTAAPYYNLVLVAILIYLFIKLFRAQKINRRVYMMPWYLLFVALIIFVVEELFTVLRTAGILNFPAHINGFFELGIIAIFIYVLLIQKQHLKK